MGKSAAPPGAKSLLRQLAQETDESATTALFMQLCRQSPALRHWLWEDFARDAARNQLARRLRPSAEPVTRFPELTGEFDAWRAEQRRLQARISRKLYGGLTWQELAKLITTIGPRRADLGLFVLAQDWLGAGASAAQSPGLRFYFCKLDSEEFQMMVLYCLPSITALKVDERASVAAENDRRELSEFLRANFPPMNALYQS